MTVILTRIFVHIRTSVKYAEFHRAIERFAGQKYGIDMPQRRYGEIAEMTLTEPALSPAFSKAKRTVEHWQQIFTTTLKSTKNHIAQ